MASYTVAILPPPQVNGAMNFSSAYLASAGDWLRFIPPYKPVILPAIVSSGNVQFG